MDRLALLAAGFAVIEAATPAEAIDIVSRTPCAVAHGVVQVWPLQELLVMAGESARSSTRKRTLR